MYITGKIKVTAVLPQALSELRNIAYNMWWTWNHDAKTLFSEIDPMLWQKLEGNPVKFLHQVTQGKLDQKANDPSYLGRYNAVSSRFNTYMAGESTWFKNTYPGIEDYRVCYFSAEFGLSEVLPVYSGGLGVLSGDHLKSASDLGIPLTAIGLFYKQGYFRQRINQEGWQETIYNNLNPSQLPVLPVINNEGKNVIISLDYPGRTLYAKVWLVSVGRVFLYLMDTDIEQNNPMDRSLTARLYGGDQETRIQQEILLGIGGMKVLETLGINPYVYHMNEGHSSFMGLELIRKYMLEKNLSFYTAKEAATASMVFTTHTPVPAGNDAFPLGMIDKYFAGYWSKLGITRNEFVALGTKESDMNNYNMTVLALKLAGKKNGVSELHGAVTRNIYNELWGDIPEDEVPINHITNGIHTLTWLSPEFKKIYDNYIFEDWAEGILREDKWSNIDNIPDRDLWDAHRKLKVDMIDFIRERLKIQKELNGEAPEAVKEVDDWLNPDALTIGFARRFATYKRANLIFRNINKIREIFNQPDRPVQIIFAGKAHPADRPAHEVIKNIHDISRQEGFKGKVVLLENYDMAVARKLVQGVDVWLNNPRRPLEASGTSGQKVCINGVLNFSVLDGWWCEGYNGKNGWTVGDDTFYSNEYTQDNADSKFIYDTLENIIIPDFYQRDDSNIPSKWIMHMKNSIKSLTYNYSTHRMLFDYNEKMYMPLYTRGKKLAQDNYDAARKLSEWKSHIEKNWPYVRLYSEGNTNALKDINSISGQKIELSIYADLAGINPDNIRLEAYYGISGKEKTIEQPRAIQMHIAEKTGDNSYKYSVDVEISDGGEYDYTFRLFPYHTDLINSYEMGLIKWLGKV